LTAGGRAAHSPAQSTRGLRVSNATLPQAGQDGEFISFQTSYHFPNKRLTTSGTLRFPSREHVETLIAGSGLLVRDVFGEWDASAFKPVRSREVILIAEIAG